MREAVLHGQAYCVIVESKGENDENQEMVYSFGRDFLCLDHCDHGSLWLVEEIKTDLLIIEKWVRN